MANDIVKYGSPKGLDSIVEVFKSETENGPSTFTFTKFSYLDDQDIAYFGKVGVRKKELTHQLFRENLEPIPDDHVYPEIVPNITHAETATEGKPFYIKRPKLSSYDRAGNDGTLPKLLLQEANLFEMLKNHPHPNIVQYYGCIVKRGRIVGLALHRYPQTLEHRVKFDKRPLDSESCLKAIESAVHHLHALGLAHNDLNPMNVVLDENDMSFLIDFGSCQPFGAQLITAGTPGWMEDWFDTSEQHHDEYSLGKMKEWLVEQTTILRGQA